MITVIVGFSIVGTSDDEVKDFIDNHTIFLREHEDKGIVIKTYKQEYNNGYEWSHYYDPSDE